MPKHDKRPNILIIHADQHRSDCLGAYGNPDIQTPHIDALARDGRRFDNSFCPFPVCTPSRYSFLSGQYVRQHGAWTNHCTLAPGIPTFPKVLRDAGYQTTAVGKMHFTPTYLDVGFQHMELAEQDGPGRYDDDYHRWLMTEGLCDRIDLMDQVREYRQHAPQTYWDSMGAMPSDLDEAHHSTTWIAGRAMDTLKTWENGGNMLMVGFIKPHHPFDPPAPWYDLYDPEDLTLLPGWIDNPIARDIARNPGYFPHKALTEATLRRVMASYYAAITQIDYHVGRMTDSLKKRGLYDNTLILYTSDHGDYMGYHHLLLKGNYMYDPLVKVPLIIKYPGQINVGTTATALVSNLDISPTLIKTAECPVPHTMQGLDLTDVQAGRESIFAEGWAGEEIMVRTQEVKLLDCMHPEQSQFFDLQKDPFELENRIDDPGTQTQITLLRERIVHWALHEARTPTYLDYDAPVIQDENVTHRHDEHVRVETAYFRRKMHDSAL